jgi:hypothetical protein
MANWDERTATVRNALVSLEDEISALELQASSSIESIEGVRRLRGALEAAKARTDGVDDLQISGAMLRELASGLLQVSAQIAQQRQNVASGATFQWELLVPDLVLDALGRWPAPLPHGSAAAIRREIAGAARPLRASTRRARRAAARGIDAVGGTPRQPDG